MKIVTLLLIVLLIISSNAVGFIVYDPTAALNAAESLTTSYQQIKQLETIIKLSESSEQEFKQIKEESQEQNQTLDTIATEAQRFEKFPDDAFKILNEKKYREKYFLKFVYTYNDFNPYLNDQDQQGQEQEELKKVIMRLYEDDELDLKDMYKLYQVMTETEEERLIRNLLEMGYSEIEIAEIIRAKRKNEAIKERLQEYTLERKRLTLLRDTLAKKIELLNEELEDEADPKSQSIMRKQITEAQVQLTSTQQSIKSLDDEIKNEQELAVYVEHIMYQDAYSLGLAKQGR